MKKTLILMALFVSLASFSQEPPQQYSFSLDQAIAHALQHNYTVINSQRDIEKAEQRKWETTATGLPQISAGADYVYNIKLQKSVIDPSAFTLPGQDPPASTDPIVIEFGSKQTFGLRSQLSQLIFDGSYLVALQASKTYLKYYQNYKRKTDSEVREMVINAYGNVLLTEESIAILGRNKSILEKTLHDTEETYKNGLIEQENVEQLQITLATVNSNLNNAQRLKVISYKMLNLNLGIDIDSKVELTDKLEGLARQNLAAAFEQNEFSLENNVDYQIGLNLQDQRRLELKLEKSKYYPTLSANVNYGTNSFGSDQFTFFQRDQRWFDYSNVGVTLSVPIFSSGGKNARVQQAKIAFEQAKTQLTETEQRLKLAYEQSRSEYEFSVEQYNTSKNNLALAERIENKQQIKFTEGLSTSFDFNDAQQQLYAAQQQYLQSMIDVINRKASLERISSK